MCNDCRKDTRQIMHRMLTVALAAPIGEFVDHNGTSLDMDEHRALLATVLDSLILIRGGNATPEQDAKAAECDRVLRSLDPLKLRGLMVSCDNLEDLFGDLHRITRLILAQRALSGETEAQRRIDNVEAMRAVVDNADRDEEYEEDDAVPHVAIIDLTGRFGGRGVGPKVPAPNTSELPH